MRSTRLLRLGAFISASALTLTLGAVPTSADESDQPFSAGSAATDGHRDGRLASGADLRGASNTASRSSSLAEIAATTANVTKVSAHSSALGMPAENPIDVDIYFSQATDVDSIESVELRLWVDGVTKGYFPVYHDESEDVFYVEVPGNIGLGKAKFTASRVHYTVDSGLAPTIDGTDSNYFYIRRLVERGGASYTDYGRFNTFFADEFYIWSPSLGNFRPLKELKLQRKSGGEWRTIKTMTLNSIGSGSYRVITTSEYYYRFLSSKTSTSTGIIITFPKI